MGSGSRYRRLSAVLGVIRVPHDKLSPEALRGTIEEFVTREGTDYGDEPVDLATKVAQVLRQLQRGEAHLYFDPATGRTQIAPGTG